MARLADNEIEHILYESDDEDIGDDATSDEEDCVFSDINSECDFSNGESVETEQNIWNTYVSKDGKYVWTDKNPDGDYGRRAAENIMDTKPGPTLYAITRTYSVESSFDLFMTTELLNIVIEMTNIEGNEIYTYVLPGL